MKNIAISPNFLVKKFCGKVQYLAFPQNFHTRKLGELAVFFVVYRNYSNLVHTEKKYFDDCALY